MNDFFGIVTAGPAFGLWLTLAPARSDDRGPGFSTLTSDAVRLLAARPAASARK